LHGGFSFNLLNILPWFLRQVVGQAHPSQLRGCVGLVAGLGVQRACDSWVQGQARDGCARERATLAA
jgi:hypothetical protein